MFACIVISVHFGGVTCVECVVLCVPCVRVQNFYFSLFVWLFPCAKFNNFSFFFLISFHFVSNMMEKFSLFCWVVQCNKFFLRFQI